MGWTKSVCVRFSKVQLLRNVSYMYDFSLLSNTREEIPF